MLILALVIFLIGAFCLAATWSEQRGGKAVRAQVLGLTNGTVGTMSTTYSGFASNYATIVRDWMQRGTNTLLVHVVNEGSAGVWLFPFATIEDTVLEHDALLLNAPNYSGILLPAHSSTNVEVAIFQPTSGRLRARLPYTRDTSADSFVRR